MTETTMTEEQTQKRDFVAGLNDLFAEHDPSRYDHLLAGGFRYVVEGADEWVIGPDGRDRCCVTGDSLTAIVEDMAAAEMF